MIATIFDIQRASFVDGSGILASAFFERLDFPGVTPYLCL